MSSQRTTWPPAATSGRISYRKAELSDATVLAPKLRPSDVAEMVLTWSGSPEDRLAESIKVSDEAWALLVDGEVEAVFGLVRYPEAHVPWMRCSAVVGKYKRALLTDAHAWLSSIHSATVPLANTVAAGNSEAIAMLEHLGFTIGELIEEYGPGRAPFYHFYRVRNV